MQLLPLSRQFFPGRFGNNYAIRRPSRVRRRARSPAISAHRRRSEAYNARDCAWSSAVASAALEPTAAFARGQECSCVCQGKSAYIRLRIVQDRRLASDGIVLYEAPRAPFRCSTAIWGWAHTCIFPTSHVSSYGARSSSLRQDIRSTSGARRDSKVRSGAHFAARPITGR